MEKGIGVRAVLAAPLLVSGLLVSGCVGSPTYGTDKTAAAQLGNDLSGMFSLKPKGNPVGEYKPRPELVKPQALTSELPAPQDNIATASNPSWPESPEAKRKRLRDEATANQDNPAYEPMIVNDISVPKREADGLSPSDRQDAESKPMSNLEAHSKRDEVRRKLAESKQGSPTSRKYLSEPPLTYREPAATAATDDIGEDEDKKARRIKREARSKKGGLRDLIPWL